MLRPRRQAGVVVSFTAGWTRGPRPLRISVIVERLKTKPWTADFIAAQLVARACLLLHCTPEELRIKSHPADGPIWRRY